MSEKSVRNTKDAPSPVGEAAFASDYLNLLKQKLNGAKTTGAKSGKGTGKSSGGKK